MKQEGKNKDTFTVMSFYKLTLTPPRNRHFQARKITFTLYTNSDYLHIFKVFNFKVFQQKDTYSNELKKKNFSHIKYYILLNKKRKIQ